MSKVVINKAEFIGLNSYVTDKELVFMIVLDRDLNEVENIILNNTKPIEIDGVQFNGYDHLGYLQKGYNVGGYDQVLTVSMRSDYDDISSLEVLIGFRPTYDEAVKKRQDIEAIAIDVPDDKAKEHTWAFENWSAESVTYKVGDRVQYLERLYKCVQAHISQTDWTPDITPSLWVSMSDPSIEYPDWVQPTGSHDAYQMGDKVSHKEKHWISTADANVWEPGVYGWDEVVDSSENTTPSTDNPSTDNPEPTIQDDIKDFEQPTASNPYKTGDKVRYNGVVYESLIDGNVWSPSDYPAGWKEVNE